MDRYGSLVSDSMEHRAGGEWLSFSQWWGVGGRYYSENLGIAKHQFAGFSFSQGICAYDDVVIEHREPQKINIGDVLVFTIKECHFVRKDADIYMDLFQRSDIYIHRVVKIIRNVYGGYYFTTKGDSSPNVLYFERNIPESRIVGISTDYSHNKSSILQHTLHLNASKIPGDCDLSWSPHCQLDNREVVLPNAPFHEKVSLSPSIGGIKGGTKIYKLNKKIVRVKYSLKGRSISLSEFSSNNLCKMIEKFKEGKPDELRRYIGYVYENKLGKKNRDLFLVSMHNLGVYYAEFMNKDGKIVSEEETSNYFFKVVIDLDKDGITSAPYCYAKNNLIVSIYRLKNETLTTSVINGILSYFSTLEGWIDGKVTDPINRVKIGVLLLLAKNYDKDTIYLFDEVVKLLCETEKLEEKFAVYYAFRNAIIREGGIDKKLQQNGNYGVIVKLNDAIDKLGNVDLNPKINQRMKDKNNRSSAFLNLAFFRLFRSLNNIKGNAVGFVCFLKSAWKYINKIDPKNLDATAMKTKGEIENRIRGLNEKEKLSFSKDLSITRI